MPQVKQIYVESGSKIYEENLHLSKRHNRIIYMAYVNKEVGLTNSFREIFSLLHSQNYQEKYYCFSMVCLVGFLENHVRIKFILILDRVSVCISATIFRFLHFIF